MMNTAKRNEKIRKCFSDSRTTARRADRYAKRMTTDEERRIAAVACCTATMEPVALGLVDRMTDREKLLKVTTSQTRSKIRLRALNRFPKDNAFLSAVRRSDPMYSESLAALYPVAARASELLKALETDRIRVAGDDQNAIAALLESGEVAAATEEALEQITDGNVLLRLIGSKTNGALSRAALRRALKTDVRRTAAFERSIANLCIAGSFTETERTAVHLLSDPALLVRILEESKDEKLQDAAIDRLHDRYNPYSSEENPSEPLTDAQQNVLFRYFSGKRRLDNSFLLNLLDRAHLILLYQQRTDPDDRLKIIRQLPPESVPDEWMDDLTRMQGADARDRWEQMLPAMGTERLRAITKDHKDWTCRIKAMKTLVNRLYRQGNAGEEINSIVQPMIDEIKTDRGHIGSKLCDIFRALPETLVPHFGFETEYDEGETIDGADWSRLILRYEGHRYWVYYSQTDGGGEDHALGEQIS